MVASLAKKIIVLLIITTCSSYCFANKTKKFIRSSTYGILTGSLLGVASLAFENKPGDHLVNVARGASLGLYLGIALGLYVTREPSIPEADFMNNELLPEEVIKHSIPALNVAPVFAKNKLDGVFVNWNMGL